MGKRKSKWTADKFRSTGAKVSAAQLRDYPLELTPEVEDFLRWQNGGIPEKDAFRISYPTGYETVARVREFYGIQSDSGDGVTDLARTVLNHWHGLPRGALPLGDVDIVGCEFDPITLLTFLWGDRAGRVFFFDNPHDVGEMAALQQSIPGLGGPAGAP